MCEWELASKCGGTDWENEFRTIPSTAVPMLSAVLGASPPHEMDAVADVCRAANWRVASLVAATVCDVDVHDEAASARLHRAMVSATNVCADGAVPDDTALPWRQLAQLIALVVSRHVKDSRVAVLPATADVSAVSGRSVRRTGADHDASSLHDLLDATNHEASSRVAHINANALASRTGAALIDGSESASTDDTLEAIQRELDEQARQRALTAVASSHRRLGAQRTAAAQLAVCVRLLRDSVPWHAMHWPVSAPDGFMPFVAPTVALLAAEGILPASAAVSPRYMMLRRRFLDPEAQGLLRGFRIEDPARLHPTLLRFVAPLRRIRADPQAWPAGPQHVARMWAAVLRVLAEHEPSL